MEALRGRRLAGVSGVLFFLLSIVIAFAGPPPPGLTATAHEIATYYSEHRLPFLIGNYAGALALVPFFPLLSYLAKLVRRAEGETGIVGITVLGTGLTAAATGFGLLAVLQAVPIVEGSFQKPLSDLANMFFGFFFIVQAAFLGASAWAVLSLDVLPRWSGWTALFVAVVSLVASAGTIVTTEPLAVGGPWTLAAFGAFLVWTLAVSLVLLIREGRASTSSG